VEQDWAHTPTKFSFQSAGTASVTQLVRLAHHAAIDSSIKSSKPNWDRPLRSRSYPDGIVMSCHRHRIRFLSGGMRDGPACRDFPAIRAIVQNFHGTLVAQQPNYFKVFKNFQQITCGF